MKVKMKHVGDGVVIVGHSGASYNAKPGEVVSLLAIDAAGLVNHPEWESVEDVAPVKSKPATAKKVEK